MKNSSSSTLAVKKAARPKTKKKSPSKALSPARKRKRKPDDDVEYLGTKRIDANGRRITRQSYQMLVMKELARKKEQERDEVEVKQEQEESPKPKIQFPKIDEEEGETWCPVCKMKIYTEGGCKTITCIWTSNHPNGEFVYYCGHCGIFSEGRLPPKCQCPYSFDKPTRLVVKANPELRTVDLSNDAFSEGLEYYQSIPGGDGNDDSGEEEEEENIKISFLERLEYCQFIGGDEDNTSRASTGSSSVSEKMGGGRDSDATDSGNPTSTKTTDDNVEDVVPTAVLSDLTTQIKQEPDAVPSTAFEEETIGNEISSQEVTSSTAIPVVVKVKNEGVNDSVAYHEETDVEDSTSSKEDGGEEDDYVAALIYQESQRRKREAAEEEEGRKAAPKKRRKATSTRNASAATAQADNGQRKRATGSGSASKGKRKLSEDEEESAPTAEVAKKTSKKRECSADGCTNWALRGGVCFRHGAKETRKLCSSEGCTKGATQGGVCIKHGAKVKQCSSEGCANQAQNGGVCIRHGAKKCRYECSADGCTNYAQKGGVCVRHGGKRKCSIEGCTNKAQRAGLCKRHGANRNALDGSTAFGSEFELTAATQTIRHHRASRDAITGGQEGSTVPVEVTILCEEIVEV